MKNLMKIAVVFLISLTTTAQIIPLNKIVNINNEENIENVSSNGNELVFNTSTNSYSYECGVDLIESNISNINDIYNGEILTGDTLGKNGSIYLTNGLNIPDGITNPAGYDAVKITSADDGSYNALFKSNNTTSYLIESQNNGSLTLNNFFNSYLDELTDLDYLQSENSLIMSTQFNNNPTLYNSLLMYDLTSQSMYLTLITKLNGDTLTGSPKSTAIYNGTLYFSTNNNNTIYKVLTIENDLIYIRKNIVVEKYASAGNGTINEFEFDSNGDVYAATNKGIYSNSNCDPISLLIEEDNILNYVSLYPNPNNGNFTITNVEYETTLNILNTNGQIVYSELTNQENVTLNTDLPNGIYFIQLTNGNTNTTLKFIKE